MNQSKRLQPRDRLDRETILERLRDCGGYLTAAEWRRQRRKPSVASIVRVFGSWRAAWDAAGIGRDKANGWIEAARLWQRLHPQGFCSRAAWDAWAGRPCSSQTVVKVFGRWNAFLQAAGLVTSSDFRHPLPSELASPYEQSWPEVWRQVWELRNRKGLSYKQAARILGMSKDRVRQIYKGCLRGPYRPRGRPRTADISPQLLREALEAWERTFPGRPCTRRGWQAWAEHPCSVHQILRACGGSWTCFVTRAFEQATARAEGETATPSTAQPPSLVAEAALFGVGKSVKPDPNTPQTSPSGGTRKGRQRRS